jgi:hypothetical protein
VTARWPDRRESVLLGTGLAGLLVLGLARDVVLGLVGWLLLVAIVPRSSRLAGVASLLAGAAWLVATVALRAGGASEIGPVTGEPLAAGAAALSAAALVVAGAAAVEGLYLLFAALGSAVLLQRVGPSPSRSPTSWWPAGSRRPPCSAPWPRCGPGSRGPGGPRPRRRSSWRPRRRARRWPRSGFSAVWRSPTWLRGHGSSRGRPRSFRCPGSPDSPPGGPWPGLCGRSAPLCSCSGSSPSSCSPSPPSGSRREAPGEASGHLLPGLALAAGLALLVFAWREAPPGALLTAVVVLTAGITGEALGALTRRLPAWEPGPREPRRTERASRLARLGRSLREAADRAGGDLADAGDVARGRRDGAAARARPRRSRAPRDGTGGLRPPSRGAGC